MFYTTVLSPTKPTLNLIDPKRSMGQDISLSARRSDANEGFSAKILVCNRM